MEIHTFTDKKAVYIDYFYDWYQARFTNLKIVVHDNHSTDNTVEMALRRRCVVETFGSPNLYEENTLIALKNSCFIDGSTDYFIVCDIDEFLDLNEVDLIGRNPSLVQSWCWQMSNRTSEDIKMIKFGTRDWYYDKVLCFKRSDILEINYQPGSHFCNPKFTKTEIEITKIRRNMFHYRWLSYEHVSSRYRRNSRRLAPSNYEKIEKWHWDASEESLRQQYRHIQKTAVKLKVEWRREGRRTFSTIRHQLLVVLYLIKSVFGGYGRDGFKTYRKDLVANVIDQKKRLFPKPWL
jgi:glycosyltransferase involved in cell wall biosynthesis